jgi:hypothetical protein
MFLSRENSAVLSSSETLSSFDHYPTSNFLSNNSLADYNDSSSGLHYVESSAALAPITTRIRPSTALTEKIILEITKSIKIFKPSRSLYHLTNDTTHSETTTEVRDQTKPTATIDVVISGNDIPIF